jgi:hypothetical protein
LNQNRSPAAIVRGEAVEEGEVGGGVEDGILLVVEAGLPKFDGTQDFDTLAFAADGDFRGMAEAAPGGVQGGVLPETGFIGKNQRSLLGAGFFLRRG